MNGQRVLISGASIAGPALAFWLDRYGADVVVVEKAPALRGGGQLIDLRGASKVVLRRMGLGEQVRAATEPNRGLSFVDERDRRQGEMLADEFGGDGPVAEIEILRGELSRVFHDETQRRVEYRFGDRIVGMEDGVDGVEVEFASGSTERFDLVIGADGVHSELRDMLFDETEQELVHLGVYLSFWTAENHTGLEDWTIAYSEPGRTIGMRTILDNSKVMAFLSFRGGPPAYDWRDVSMQRRIALARASGMGWEAAQLLAQVETASDFYFDNCQQVKLSRWSRGRVALLGDAAYCASPLSGYGATIATVGAYVLAGELARAKGDHAQAFAEYERKLRPWIALVHESAPSQGKLMTPETASGIRLRNTLVRLSRFLPDKKILVRDQMRLSNALEVDDYPATITAI